LLPERLSKNPRSLFPEDWGDYMSQMFEIYAEDVRPEVRKAACADLHNLNSRKPTEQCR